MVDKRLQIAEERISLEICGLFIYLLFVVIDVR